MYKRFIFSNVHVVMLNALYRHVLDTHLDAFQPILDFSQG